MFNEIKIDISNFIHNNFKSYFINYKNKKVLNSYNSISKIKTNYTYKYKRVLIDGGFYNLGYFYRLQLLRSSIKSLNQIEKAFIWDCNFKMCKKILKSIGLKDIYYLNDKPNRKTKELAETLASSLKTKEEIINLKLPENIPGYLLYDIILRLQRNATVDLKDKNLKKYIFKFLNSIDFSKKLINEFKPEVIILSHATSYPCSAIAWVAAQKKIPVFVLTGDHGIPRIWKILKPKDIFLGFGYPINKNIKNLTYDKKLKIIENGKKYIEERISGNTSDIGGRFAFQRKNKELEELKKICKNKKVVAIYSNTFYDFPHTFGMSRFLDVLDWLKNTINIAKENKNIFWLIRPHPLDEWYGGIKLKDLLPEILPENIILLSYEYSGKDILEISDGLVTHHGTAAIEFAVMGKPVLIADKGWFHEFGFVKFPKNKNEYFENLSFKWQKTTNQKLAQTKANLFAGIFYGIPEWQKEGIMPDDSDTDKLRKKLPIFIKNKKNIISKEIKLIRKWIDSDNFDYHSFKIVNSKKFAILRKVN